jgi:hypothetical protein
MSQRRGQKKAVPIRTTFLYASLFGQPGSASRILLTTAVSDP